MILLTGSKGRLGTELQKHLEIIPFEGDLTQLFARQECDLIIHAAAYTSVEEAENDVTKCFAVNVLGTEKLVDMYKDIPFVYISTEYAKEPLGVYAMTKRMGEIIVKHHQKHLIIRTLFKPRPWPFKYAYRDQMTNGDYVDVIAELIVKEINEWKESMEKFKTGFKKECYVGTTYKSMLDLARQTKADVIPNHITSKLVPHFPM